MTRDEKILTVLLFCIGISYLWSIGKLVNAMVFLGIAFIFGGLAVVTFMPEGDMK